MKGSKLLILLVLAVSVLSTVYCRRHDRDDDDDDDDDSWDDDDHHHHHHHHRHDKDEEHSGLGTGKIIAIVGAGVAGLLLVATAIVFGLKYKNTGRRSVLPSKSGIADIKPMKSEVYTVPISVSPAPPAYTSTPDFKDLVEPSKEHAAPPPAYPEYTPVTASVPIPPAYTQASSPPPAYTYIPAGKPPQAGKTSLV